MLIAGSLFFACVVTSCAEVSVDDLWTADAYMSVTENGNGEEHILKNYEPKNEKPFVSFEMPFDDEEISCFIDCESKSEVRVCKNCDEKLIYTDVLYEINEDCGHGIFAKGYFCQKDKTFTPDNFYTKCGCHQNKNPQVQPYMNWVLKLYKSIIEK